QGPRALRRAARRLPRRRLLSLRARGLRRGSLADRGPGDQGRHSHLHLRARHLGTGGGGPAAPGRVVRGERIEGESTMTDRPDGGSRTLCIDIGGTGIKAMVVSSLGKPLGERARIETPHPATPKALRAALLAILPDPRSFDRISVGFPGVVHAGVVRTA